MTLYVYNIYDVIHNSDPLIEDLGSVDVKFNLRIDNSRYVPFILYYHIFNLVYKDLNISSLISGFLGSYPHLICSTNSILSHRLLSLYLIALGACLIALQMI